MKCCFCGSNQSRVIDKREVLSSGEIRRRRECLKCRKRYTTYERVAGLELIVIKRDGRKEHFDREKLRNGIEKALEKRPAVAGIDAIVMRIEAKFRTKGVREVTTRMIGQAVLVELKKLDQIAYLRFASVYRGFQDASDFAKEVETLEKIANKFPLRINN